MDVLAILVHNVAEIGAQAGAIGAFWRAKPCLKQGPLCTDLGCSSATLARRRLRGTDRDSDAHVQFPLAVAFVEGRSIASVDADVLIVLVVIALLG